MFGVATAACVACSVGPILGLLAALGLGTVAAGLLFGAIGLVVAAVVSVVVLRRRRRQQTCVVREAPVAIGMPRVRSVR